MNSCQPFSDQVLGREWQAADAANVTPFDRKNVIGLHRLALIVPQERSI